MHKKLPLLLTITISLLLLCQTAHADFRKALDAYIARDGATMLKEVKDAVDKKNDDGLMLFLMATNMDAATSDYDETTKQSKSTLRAILPQPKWDEMRELLVQATNSSTVDAQYYFLTATQFRPDSIEKIINEYASKGSKLAMLRLSEEDKAKAGSPFAQLILGLKYLNFTTYIGYGCAESKEPICQTKNEEKGYYWLRQAAKSFEVNGSSAIGAYADSMCELFQNESQFNNPAGLRQAYLWCVMGVNTGGQSSMRLLDRMYVSGKLKTTAPELDAIWSDEKKRKVKLFPSTFKELPDWIDQARKELSKEDVPQISFTSFDNMPYRIDVYKDGRIKMLDNFYLGESQTESVLLKKVSPSLVKAFLADLKKTGYYQWSVADLRPGFCPKFIDCHTAAMVLTVRHGTQAKRMNLHIASTNKLLDKNWLDVQRMAKLKTLVDKYFPTKQLRIELGNSEKIKQKMLDRENEWQLVQEKVN
jgi:TPR repeat protein